MTTKIIAPAELDAVQKDRMFQLMATHYDGVKPDVFLQDLQEKDAVILLEEEGEVIGFSTQKIIETHGIRAVFSGDTIIGRAHWGTQQLSRAFARHFFSHPDGPLYWFLISKGYKTYKYLPTFFRTFYPRYDQETPADMKMLLDALGQRLYPDTYCPKTGVITYGEKKDRLKPELVDLSAREGDPHYDFFVQANPNFASGDDLACITLLSRDNLRKGTERILFGKA